MQPSKFTNCKPDEDEVVDFTKSVKEAVSGTSSTDDSSGKAHQIPLIMVRRKNTLMSL